MRRSLVATLATARFAYRNLLAGKRAYATMLLLLVAPLIGGLVAAANPEGLRPVALFHQISFGFIIKFLLVLITIIYGIALTSGEIEEGTVGYLYLCALPRWAITLIHFTVAAVSLSILVLMSVLLTAGACAIAPGAEAGHLLRLGLRLSVVTTIGTCVFLGFFMFCGLMFKRPLVVGIFTTFIWEIFATMIPMKLAAYTVTNNLYSLWFHLVLGGERGRWLRHVKNFELPTYGGASTFLSTLLGLFLVGMMVAAMNRSIEGKEAR